MIFLFSQRWLEIFLLFIPDDGTLRPKHVARLENQYVCRYWRSTCHLSHKCHNGMSKIDLYPSCGTTCSEVGRLV